MRRRALLVAGLALLATYSLVLIATYRALGGWLATFLACVGAIAVVLVAPRGAPAAVALALALALEGLMRTSFAIEGRGLDYLSLLNAGLAIAFLAAAVGSWRRAPWTWLALAAGTLVSGAFVAHELVKGRWEAVGHYAIHAAGLLALTLSSAAARP